MSKIITQKAEENKQISERIKSFMKRFEVSSALKSSNAVKIKGFAIIEIFQYLFMLVFAHRSIYMDMKRDTVPFSKDTVYRFLNSARINWLKFTTRLSAKIIEEAIDPLTSEQRENVLIIDDSVFERNRSKKVELLTKVFDHAKRRYIYGFRMLTLGWSDGNTFMPVNSVLLSSENDKTVMNIPEGIDKRTNAYKRRNLSRSKANDAMITLIKQAKAACIKASYVLFDSWFASPDSICKIRNLGYDVIAMIKKTPKVFYEYNGKMMSQGRLMFTIFAGLAEFERECTLQRQAEGIAEAKKRGVYKGRIPKPYDEVLLRIECENWRNGEQTATSVMRKLNMSSNRFYRIVNRLGIGKRSLRHDN